jgi:hypothetical protein
MKYLLILIGLVLCLNVHSQTEALEAQNLASRYAKGDFNQIEYSQFGKDWNDLLKSLGGYPKLPYNAQTKVIEFKSIKTFSNIDKKTIYDRTMEWLALTFGSLTSVLNYSNLDNGKIIVKGWFEVYYKIDVETFWTSKKEKANSVKCNFTYIFTIKDNRLKMEVVNINYEYNIPYSLIGSLYVPSYTITGSISDLYPVSDGEPILWKGKLDLLNKTNIRITSLFQDLENYINNKSKDYDF